MDEIIIAVIDLNQCDIGWKEGIENWSDKDFLELALKTDKTYTLPEYQVAWNKGELGFDTYIRFMKKPF